MQCIIDVLSSWYSLKRADIVAPSNIKCDWFWLAYDISKVLYYCTLIVVKQSLWSGSIICLVYYWADAAAGRTNIMRAAIA